MGDNKIFIGPSGNGQAFYGLGYKHSYEAPAWLNSIGLNAYEYSFGRGFTTSFETAALIGAKAEECGVLCSVHAPYYINLANTDEEMIEKSFNYILTSLRYLRAFRGKHCVIHVASQGKLERNEALKLVRKRLIQLRDLIYQESLDDMLICIETMGKPAQIGTYSEIIDLCMLDKIFIPTFDFGHINALEGGSLKQESDYDKIFDLAFEKLDKSKVINCHIHFSKIEFKDKGEIRHLDFDDEIFGPCFEPLAAVIKRRGLTPHIICESKSKMSEDALTMKKLLFS